LNKLTTGFKTTGAAYPDSIELLLYLNSKHSWNLLSEQIIHDNLLKKKSNRWIGHLVQYFKKRYVVMHDSLPNVENLSTFASKVKSHSARIQALYQYICESDAFVDVFVTDLVAAKLVQYGPFRLTPSDYDEFIAKEVISHPEVMNWSPKTIKKIRGDLFAFLRSSGLMEKHPSATVRKFMVRPEAFAFFLYGLLSKNNDTSSALKSHLWIRYFLSSADIDALLAECQVRGWLQYRNFGGISELVLRFKSLEEWLIALE
jgi:hypothetical protein